MASTVALVTDSTASLPTELAERFDVTVVPLHVIIGSKAYDEGVEGGVTTELLSEALREWTPVSTSRPNPEEFGEVYRRLADEGAEQIVSIHISGELSGTFESAQLAAAKAPVPVTTIDTRQVGIGTGFAVLAAARARADGADAEGIADAARATAVATTSLFYVDTLEYLRRGGRVGAAAALLGSALAVKPILALENGRVGPRERVRTAAKALARLEELAIESADALVVGDAPDGDVPDDLPERKVAVAVAHLSSPDRAATLAEHLAARLGEHLDGELLTGEIGAVLGAHVGPGMVAVCVAPLGD